MTTRETFYRLALLARVNERTARSFLEGRALKRDTRERCEAAARELGLRVDRMLAAGQPSGPSTSNPPPRAA